MSRFIELAAAETVWQSAPAVIAAWAFGSARDGQVRSGGDVDVGILTAEPLSLDDRLSLVIELQAAWGYGDVDLVVLNDANPILRFEAVSGRRLFCRDVAAMAAFVSLTAREYEDEMAQWQRALASSRENY